MSDLPTNIRRLIREENRAQDAKEYVASIERTAHMTRWEDDFSKRKRSDKERKRVIKRQKEKDRLIAVRERRYKLKTLYEREAKQWVQALASKGLAVATDL